MSSTLTNGYSAERLRQARDLAHLTQVEMARRLRLSPRSIQGYEAGTTTPSPRVRRRLVAFMERVEAKAA